jgi:hypothetical protein
LHRDPATHIGAKQVWENTAAELLAKALAELVAMCKRRSKLGFVAVTSLPLARVGPR